MKMYLAAKSLIDLVFYVWDQTSKSQVIKVGCYSYIFYIWLDLLSS